MTFSRPRSIFIRTSFGVGSPSRGRFRGTGRKASSDEDEEDCTGLLGLRFLRGVGVGRGRSFFVATIGFCTIASGEDDILITEGSFLGVAIGFGIDFFFGDVDLILSRSLVSFPVSVSSTSATAGDM